MNGLMMAITNFMEGPLLSSESGPSSPAGVVSARDDLWSVFRPGTAIGQKSRNAPLRKHHGAVSFQGACRFVPQPAEARNLKV
jgi:hypothetical protein